MVNAEKMVVFDEATGNPKEIRYYEDDKLAARLGIILDGDNNFIGLRELSVEEVSPPSWLQKLGFRKKPEIPRINIQTIDFIGLINWINTIKTIKTIENIDLVKAITEVTNIKNVESIDLIDLITKISEITTIKKIESIRDLTYTPKFLIINPLFSQDDLGWILSTDALIDSTTYHTPPASLKLRGDVTGTGAFQYLPFPIKTDWVTEWHFWDLKSSGDAQTLRWTFFYMDNTIENVDFSSLYVGSFGRHSFTLTAGKYIYAMRLQVVTLGGPDVWVDTIMTVI